MPSTTTFNSAKYEEAIEAILDELLLDYFPAASYTITFQPPSGPTKPTFSPGFNWKLVSTKRICLPYCLEMFEKLITTPYMVS